MLFKENTVFLGDALESDFSLPVQIRYIKTIQSDFTNSFKMRLIKSILLGFLCSITDAHEETGNHYGQKITPRDLTKVRFSSKSDKFGNIKFPIFKPNYSKSKQNVTVNGTQPYCPETFMLLEVQEVVHCMSMKCLMEMVTIGFSTSILIRKVGNSGTEGFRSQETIFLDKLYPNIVRTGQVFKDSTRGTQSQRGTIASSPSMVSIFYETRYSNTHMSYVIKYGPLG